MFFLPNARYQNKAGLSCAKLNDRWHFCVCYWLWLLGWVENQKFQNLIFSCPKLDAIHKNKNFLENRYFEPSFSLYLKCKNRFFVSGWCNFEKKSFFLGRFESLLFKNDFYTQNLEFLYFHNGNFIFWLFFIDQNKNFIKCHLTNFVCGKKLLLMDF